MKLDCVLTAVNENKLYIDFIPLFVKTWNKLYPGVDVKIILIANRIPKQFKNYKDNIILFEPIKNVSTSFTSQFIRLLYPRILNYKNGVMITDIDMLPMNKTYYTKNIKTFSNNKFINTRDWNDDYQFASCYNVATPEIWAEIFNINNLEDIKDTIIDINSRINYEDGHGKNGWHTDQLFLYRKIIKWNKKTNNYIFLKDSDTGFNRLARRFKKLNKHIINNIINGKYSDYHCYRPMSKYSKLNWKIYNLL